MEGSRRLSSIWVTIMGQEQLALNWLKFYYRTCQFKILAFRFWKCFFSWSLRASGKDGWISSDRYSSQTPTPGCCKNDSRGQNCAAHLPSARRPSASLGSGSHLPFHFVWSHPCWARFPALRPGSHSVCGSHRWWGQPELGYWLPYEWNKLWDPLCVPSSRSLKSGCTLASRPRRSDIPSLPLGGVVRRWPTLACSRF